MRRVLQVESFVRSPLQSPFHVESFAESFMRSHLLAKSPPSKTVKSYLRLGLKGAKNWREEGLYLYGAIFLRL